MTIKNAKGKTLSAKIYIYIVLIDETVFESKETEVSVVETNTQNTYKN